MKAGFIGLGAMGAPMAHNLAEAGLLVAVWNRSPARAQTFARENEGVTAAADPAQLASACDVVLTCVSADGDLLEVVEAMLPGLGDGKIVVDCSTVAMETAEAAAAKLRDVGARFLDAPVSGGTEGAARGTLSMMVGGDADTFADARPVLERMASRIVHMGPVGTGQATKAVNQIMVAGINQAVTEGLAFAEALGLPMGQVIDVVGNGAAGSWFVNNRGRTMVEGRFPLGFKVALHHKDLEICRRMATRHGANLPLVEETLAAYDRLLDQGHGDEDISSLYRLKRGTGER